MKHPFQWMALVVIVQFTISCKSEDPETYILPKQIILYEQGFPSSIVTYSYSGNKITKVDGSYSFYRYHYNASGKLEYSTWKKPDEAEKILMRYQYEKDTLVRSTLYSTDPEDGSESAVLFMEYTYPDKNVIQRTYVDFYDSRKEVEEWHFNEDGNIYLTKIYHQSPEKSEFVHMSNKYYRFDLSPTPFDHIHSREVFDIWNSHNIVYEELQDLEGTIQNSREFRYLYNEDGFPTYRLEGNDTLEHYIYN